MSVQVPDSKCDFKYQTVSVSSSVRQWVWVKVSDSEYELKCKTLSVS